MYYTFISQGLALWFFFFCTVVYFSMHFWPPCDKDHFEFIFLPIVMYFIFGCWCFIITSVSDLIDWYSPVVFPRVPVFLYESCCPIDAFSVEWSRALVVEFSSTIQIYHNSFIRSFFMKKFPYRTNFSFESKEGISDRRW